MSTPPENRVRFDKTINLGHVFTVISFLFLTVAQWNMMDKRVVVLEEARSVQRERDAVQDTTIKENSREVKEAVNDLRRSIEKLSDKLGATR